MAKVAGYELLGEWKNNSSSKTVIATKDGKKYFLKKYVAIVKPINNGSLSPRGMALAEERFNKFKNIRVSINREIRTFARSGGDIIIPVEEFMDENNYVEASDFITDKVDDDKLEDVIKSLDLNARKKLLITATGALKTVHSHNIVHSDLKLKNILLVKNSHGGYSAKLIDFDNSYIIGNLPDEPGGDIFYYSPELALLSQYSDDLEERAPYEADMTTKSDIFSLGLIFHFYLTGEHVKYADLPPNLIKLQEKGKSLSPTVVLLNGGKLVVSNKIKEPALKALVESMLKLKHEDRPDATEVYKTLVIGGEAKTPPVEPTRPSADTPPSTPASGFDTPWEEDNIEFNIDFIKTRGFTSVKRKVQGAYKGYDFYTKGSSTPRFLIKKTVLMYEFARELGADGKSEEKVLAPVEDSNICEPFEEHNIVFDKEMIKSRGYVSIERIVQNGQNKYKLVDSKGTVRVMDHKMCLALKIAQNK